MSEASLIQILETVARALGEEQCNNNIKRIFSAKEKETTTTTTTTVTAVEAEPPKEENLKQVRDQVLEALTKAFEGTEVKITPKVKTDFRTYVNAMSATEFKAKKIEEHIDAFKATLAEKKPAKKTASAVGAGAGHAKRTKKQANPSEKKEEMPVVPNLDDIPELTHEQLKQLKVVTRLSNFPKRVVFSNGKYYKGPEEDEDEEVDDVNHSGINYQVGRTTGCVYTFDDEGDSVFTGGYAGVADFAEL